MEAAPANMDSSAILKFKIQTCTVNNPLLLLQKTNDTNSPIVFELCWLGLRLGLNLGLLVGSLVVVLGRDGGGLGAGNCAGFFSSEVL